MHGVEPPVVVDPFTVEQPPDQPDRLVETVEPFAKARTEVEPERVMLGLEPAPTEAEDEASARQVVDRGGELRGQPRTAERVGTDEEAQADALGRRGERRDRRPAFELRVGRIALVGQQVIVDPQRIPAGALDRETRVAQLGPGRSLDPERRAEAHRSPRARVAYRRSVSGPPDIPPALRDAILDWYVARGRSLPFRRSTDPYAILVSEAMAQQTQAARAGDAWTRFMDRFPTVETLAAATPADVLRAWQGLGYNRRALNLWRAARRIVDEFGGRVPADLVDLQSLPGVGPYTARAVAALAFGLPVGAVDTNVRRVLGRIVAGEAGLLSPGEMQRLADKAVPLDRAADWTHAVMDVGAMVCGPRVPDCARVPGAAVVWICEEHSDAADAARDPIQGCPRERSSVPDHLALAPWTRPGPSPRCEGRRMGRVRFLDRGT